MNDIEFLLINDGSTDRTMDIIVEKIKGDPRFHLFSMSNHGYGYACNYGISHAKGEYVAIYEPDDTIDNDFYSTLSDIATRFPHIDVIRYNGFYKNVNGSIKKLYTWNKKYTEQVLDKYQMKRFWRSHPSVYNGIYRTEFLKTKNIVFCESPGASFQDVTFMVSLFYSNPSIYIINKSKYYYTIHDAQSINNVYSKVDNVIMNWNCEYEWIKRKGINDESFFIYKICMQAHSMCMNIEEIGARNKILHSLYKFFKFKFLMCNVATMVQRYLCMLMYAESIMYTCKRRLRDGVIF